MDTEQNAVRRVCWRVLPLLFAAYFVAYIDRVNVGFAALTMNRDLGLSAEQYGLAAGLFFTGYVIFAVPSNLLLARIGARVWIPIIMVCWGIASLCNALFWALESQGFIPACFTSW
jgi:ACS family tartrate transporter-like MFS transporter